MIIDPNDFSKYVITGKLVRGGTFRNETTNIHHALGINLWNGRVWGVKKNGKRKLLKRVTN